MPENKDRLYVCLFARGGGVRKPGEGEYHWALMSGLKREGEYAEGTRYHAKNDIRYGIGSHRWVYEERHNALFVSNMMLVRILIGKITNLAGLRATLSSVPIVQDDPTWTCKVWVINALAALRANGSSLGTCLLDWETVSNTAMGYCQQKKDQHRFDGRGDFDMSRVATYDLLEGRETIP
ncbi:MAG: hypothetical protein M1832_002454 [Thelocarpon impressellum]|nr:MAG: hypothetical protein M1832_002454 [Thelocarpon impressellum]